MAQQDVFDVLRENKRGMTSKEIHKKVKEKGINISKGTVTTNLSKLVRSRGTYNYENNGIVMRYYPESLNRPKYILREYATEEMKEKTIL